MLYKCNHLHPNEILSIIVKHLPDDVLNDDTPINETIVRNFLLSVEKEIEDYCARVEEYLNSYFIFGDKPNIKDISKETKSFIVELLGDVVDLNDISTIIKIYISDVGVYAFDDDRNILIPFIYFRID